MYVALSFIRCASLVFLFLSIFMLPHDGHKPTKEEHVHVHVPLFCSFHFQEENKNIEVPTPHRATSEPSGKDMGLVMTLS